MNGHLPSPGWSHSILRMVTQHKEYDHQPSRRWSPIFQGMVTNHSQDGPPPSKSRSPTNMRNAAHHHRNGHPLCQGYGPTPSPWWSPTNSVKLTTIHRIVIAFPSTVTHHLKDSKLDLEFDSRAVKLVNLVVILAQLVSPSVALPAQPADLQSHLNSIQE